MPKLLEGSRGIQLHPGGKLSPCADSVETTLPASPLVQTRRGPSEPYAGISFQTALLGQRATCPSRSEVTAHHFRSTLHPEGQGDP